MSDGIFNLSPGPCPRGWTWVHGGQQLNSVLPSVRYSITLTTGRNPTKFGVCVLLT